MTATVSIQHKSLEAWRAGPRVPIFTIVHDDDIDENGNPRTVEWTMPEKPNAGFALVYLKAARTMGDEAALAWLFELAIGEDAYDALAAEADLDMDDLGTLMMTVQKRVLGGLEAPKGS